MDERSLALLDFPSILERLEAAAASEPGKLRARAARPSDDPDEVALRQARTSEAIALLDHAAEPDLGPVTDVREAVELAARGSVLDPPGLRDLGLALRAGVEARRAILSVQDVPLLAALVEPVEEDLDVLAGAIERAVEDDGSDLRDGATPTLRRLRRQLREGRAHLADHLRRLARDPSLAPHLQDDFVTERGGRPVLALRASARGAVPGIVHDSSSTGQTLFVEPFAVVDDSNRLREAEGAERGEVVRILSSLSAAVGARATSIATLVDAVSELDLAVASGRLSRAWRGAPVVVGAEVALVGARHPLLDPARVVPIDLELGALRALVVSGPNTGGKTVALKTLGLAALLHQTGLRLPAVSARLPVFDSVLADIGDEQSIVTSLSTFSAHVRSLIGILTAATDRSLVLLDEVAAGTDPAEGAALAQALLARLAGQARLTVVTSHYAELKEWASATDGVANAATALDRETNEPLYRVTLGRPGTSHALQTAERLGLPEDVVAAARAKIEPDRLRIARLVADAEDAERRAQDELASAEAARREAELACERADARAAELAREIDGVRASAQAERARVVAAVEDELAGARAELDGLRAEVRAARREERLRSTRAAAEERERARDRHLGAAAAHAETARETLAQLAEHAPAGRLPVVGDPVVAPALGVQGTVAELVGSEATVVGRGGLRVKLPLEALRIDAPAHEESADAVLPFTVLAEEPVESPAELDLRGLTSSEARETVRAFVDRAALAGHREVRIVHGRGTGAIRAATRDELARHPLVGSTESDAGDGATIVRLD